MDRAVERVLRAIQRNERIILYGDYDVDGVTSLALLRAGLEPTSQVQCTATTSVNGKQFKNYSDYPSSAIGTIPLQEAIAQSCNTALINARGKVGDGDLAAAAASLGLGIDHDLGFPAYFGEVPPPASETEGLASTTAAHRAVRARVASIWSSWLTRITPSMRSATTAGSGRSRTATATVAVPSLA